MKFRMLAVAAVALTALGGCATYDYVSGSTPGGYYTGQPQVEYYGSYGYGYPYGGYGYGYYGGSPYGYYGYPYGYYGGYYYRPPYSSHHPRPPHPRPGGDGNATPPPSPPIGHRPDGNRAPWRDLDRLTEEKGQQRGQRSRPAPPRAYRQAPQGNAPRATAMPAPAPRPQADRPQPRSQGGGGMTRAIERARQAREP